MYCQYFGLSKSPFKITPDPELFFPGGNRGAVLDALVYAVSRGEGIVKLVGEVGSGKTMLCRMLERELPRHCEIIYLANPNLGPDELLQTIAFELRLKVPDTASKPELTRLLHDYLLNKHADNRHVVMFVEEAQGMPLATLEELRLLSNLETAQDKLLQIVLFGQPELDHKLSAHEIRQLNERITYRFNLGPFEPSEIRDYLNTRLHASGYRGPELFSPSAIRALARHSRGLLRRINVLADKALLAAYSCGDRHIRPKHVTLAARDSEFRRPRATPPRWRWPVALTGGLAAALGVQVWRAEMRPLAIFGPPGEVVSAPASDPMLDAHYQDLTDFSYALAGVDSTDLLPNRDSEITGIAAVFDNLEQLIGAPARVLTLGVDRTVVGP